MRYSDDDAELRRLLASMQLCMRTAQVTFSPINAVGNATNRPQPFVHPTSLTAQPATDAELHPLERRGRLHLIPMVSRDYRGGRSGY